MPYYPEDQTEEGLKKVRQNNVCSVCGRMVVQYLDRKKGQVYIACSGGVHEGIVREYHSPREDYESNIRREIELEKEHGLGASKALAEIPKQGQLTQPQAERILSLVYPSATKEEILRTAIFCRDFGLHPLANEVYLIPFKGKNVMVVGIPASRKMAHALKGAFSFLDDTPRVATEEEIIKQYGKDSEEAELNIISITKLEGEDGNLAIGFGLYLKSEKPYGMDKGNTRRNMANIRSERQAMDRLPGKAIPKFEVIDAAYAEVPDVGKVDTLTGEVIKGEIVKPEAKSEPEPVSTLEVKHDSPEAPKPSNQKGIKVDIDWLITTVNETRWDVLRYIRDTFKTSTDGDLKDIVNRLSDEQKKELVKAAQERADLK